MIAQTTLPGLGTADHCVASGSHDPRPTRFVWHHLQPKECGGATNLDNCIPVCDTCHYTIHRILYALAFQALGTPFRALYQDLLIKPPRRLQLGFATIGFARCVAAETADQIPNEG
jgi:hypothetical protein